MTPIRAISLTFAAGSLGGLIKAGCAWTFGALGVNAALAVKMAPAWTPFFLYQHMVWGGIWGLVFLVPARRMGLLWQGIIFSLPMTLSQLFFMFPKMGSGMLGLNLGRLTPVLVLFFGFVWGWATALWLKLSSQGRG
jgi:hypothetical protein